MCLFVTIGLFTFQSQTVTFYACLLPIHVLCLVDLFFPLMISEIIFIPG